MGREEQLTKITLEFETYKQTLKGEEARIWLQKMASGIVDFPMEVVTAKWKKHKIKRRFEEPSQ